MNNSSEKLLQLQKTCIQALRNYIREAGKTCAILEDINTFPVSTEAKLRILEQRQLENAAHERYQHARRNLFAAAWSELP